MTEKSVGRVHLLVIIIIIIREIDELLKKRILSSVENFKIPKI